jgi:hypothetical protein
MASVAIPDKYYWAKVHSHTNKIDTQFSGVQFSTNGTLLITHSSSKPSGFIVVYDTGTG